MCLRRKRDENLVAKCPLVTDSGGTHPLRISAFVLRLGSCVSELGRKSGKPRKINDLRLTRGQHAGSPLANRQETAE